MPPWPALLSSSFCPPNAVPDVPNFDKEGNSREEKEAEDVEEVADVAEKEGEDANDTAAVDAGE